MGSGCADSSPGTLRLEYEVSDTSIDGGFEWKCKSFGSRAVRLTLTDERAEPSQPIRTRALTYGAVGSVLEVADLAG